MARVTGKKGTLNEGVVGDVAVVEGLTADADHDDEWKPADDPAADVDRLAQAVIRGEVADYSANPIDLLVVAQNDLEKHAHSIVLGGGEAAVAEVAPAPVEEAPVAVVEEPEKKAKKGS